MSKSNITDVLDDSYVKLAALGQFAMASRKLIHARSVPTILVLSSFDECNPVIIGRDVRVLVCKHGANS
jgi:hypothetical protein